MGLRAPRVPVPLSLVQKDPFILFPPVPQGFEHDHVHANDMIVRIMDLASGRLNMKIERASPNSVWAPGIADPALCPCIWALLCQDSEKASTSKRTGPAHTCRKHTEIQLRL